ncbi:MAG: 16S rRNA (guanine(966)-N(2))-methyltransferase RsmD [Smithellaceae bacterium]|jgi:16S rRNA (guanine(966)-N(2))-methyltransferase RsmD
MRIIGGELKGRRLSFPARSKERPTSDFLRETLFNLLGSLEGKIFLDLFAGSGSVGLEAASRGAREVYLIEKNKDLVEVIKNNIQTCSLEQKCRVIGADMAISLRDLFKKKYEVDVVFADPPYNRNLTGTILKTLNKYRVLREGGVVVIQHSTKENCGELLDENIQQIKQKKYGENALTFFKME